MVSKLLDPALINNDHGLPDYPLSILSYILKALPSQQAFSIQNFLRSWNTAGKVPLLQPNEDIYVLADGLIPQLPLIPRRVGMTPVFTKYLLRMVCDCGNNQLMDYWDGKAFDAVPSLQVERVRDQTRVRITALLNNFIGERQRGRCNVCNSLNDNLSLEVVKGMFTVLNMKRHPVAFDRDGSKVMTKLEIEPDSNQSAVLTQELISVVNHVGNLNGGHWLSYHKVGQHWYCNDDSRRVFASHHPFNAVAPETSNLLIFLNKNF